MRALSFAALAVLSIGIAGYALAVYGLTPLGAFVHCDMRTAFEANRAGIFAHIFPSAVMLRLYLPASANADIHMDVAYPYIAWLCWVPNLAIAELLFNRKRVVQS